MPTVISSSELIRREISLPFFWKLFLLLFCDEILWILSCRLQSLDVMHSTWLMADAERTTKEEEMRRGNRIELEYVTLCMRTNSSVSYLFVYHFIRCHFHTPPRRFHSLFSLSVWMTITVTWMCWKIRVHIAKRNSVRTAHSGNEVQRPFNSIR